MLTRFVPRQSITNRDTTSIDLYLKEIAKYKPLTLEEELELGKQLKNGDSDARDKLLLANLKFVVSVAKQYQGKGLPLEDLISYGNLGLTHALEKWEPERNYKLISYGVWWIRQSIGKAIQNFGETVRLPASQLDPINKLNRLSNEFEQVNGRKPNVVELAKLAELPEEKVADLLTSTNTAVRIDAPTTEDEDCTIADIISNGDRTDKEVEEKSLADSIQVILSKLPNREHDILCMLYGLDGVKEMKYDEIARKFSLSGERIRQLKEQILKKLRTTYLNDFKKL